MNSYLVGGNNLVIMAVDVLAMQGARVSAAIILT